MKIPPALWRFGVGFALGWSAGHFIINLDPLGTAVTILGVVCWIGFTLEWGSK